MTLHFQLSLQCNVLPITGFIRHTGIGSEQTFLARLIVQNNHPTFNSSMLNNLHANSLMCSLYTLHLIVPGPVCQLRYKEDADTSVTITWKPPKEPNGDIVAYFVEHGVYQNESTTSVRLNARRPKHTVIRALGKLLPFHIVAIYVYLSIFTSKYHTSQNLPPYII